MNKNDIEKAINDHRRFREMFGDRLNQLNNPALESIRALQTQMMLPNDRLLELSRSAAAATAMSVNKELLKGFSNAFAPTMSAIQALSEQVARSQMNQLADIGREVARRQAELLGSSWSSAIFASAFKAPEIDSLLQGISSQVANINADFLKTFGAGFLRSIQQSGALANLDLLRQTHAGGLARQFREAVEKSESGEELATNISSIVEKDLKEAEGNKFITRERLMVAIAILGLLFQLYQAFLQTLQYLDSRPQQTPVIQINILRELPRDLLRKFFPSLINEDVEYLLERDAKLMLRPTFRSQQMGMAFNGSRARLIARNHKWIFVEAFHPFEGISQFGWLNKKYSKRISKPR